MQYQVHITFKLRLKYTPKMSNKSCENNNNSPHKSIIHQFEHGERLKAEREAKDRQKAQFAKRMAKFGEGAEEKPKSDGDVNQKAKMFVEIANKDPQQERAEKERKLEFERKKLGFQEGSVPSTETQVRTISFIVIFFVSELLYIYIYIYIYVYI